MIYHEKKFRVAGAPALEWWAVDSDSLVIARCRVEKGPRFSLEIVRADKNVPAIASHRFSTDVGESAIAILLDCRKHFMRLAACPAALSLVDRDEVDLPEYILLGEPGEIPSSIMHSSDPVFIAFYQPGELFDKSKQSLVSYSSNIVLPEAGWEYWCTDAHQEIERMLDCYLDDIQESLKLGLKSQKVRQSH